MSLDIFSAVGLAGLMSSATVLAVGTISWSSSSRFCPTSWFKLNTQGLRKRIAHGGAALFGRLRILIGDERLPHDLAVAIDAEPKRNLLGGSVSRCDPACAQRGANVARVGNQIFRYRVVPYGIDRDAHTRDYNDRESLRGERTGFRPSHRSGCLS
jgi:hypothetical protein